MTLFFIFLAGIFCGYFRLRYNSIIPSIYVHVFFNIGGILASSFFVIFFLNPIDRNKMIAMRYYGDDTTYNFDLNDLEKWGESYCKYFDLGRQYVEKAAKNNIKGFVPIAFTIDTCGNVINVHIDTVNYPDYKYLGYGCEEEALRFVKEWPKCKPLVINGMKQEEHTSLPVFF